MFSDLVDMLDHKKYYCKLRFTCKCDSANENSGPGCQAEGGCSSNNNNNINNGTSEKGEEGKIDKKKIDKQKNLF